MPFKSEAQRSFLYAKHPKIAKKWSVEYGDGEDLPKKVEKKKKTKVWSAMKSSTDKGGY